jgi:hypothetical protein
MFSKKELQEIAVEYDVSVDWLEEKFLDLIKEYVLDEECPVQALLDDVFYDDGDECGSASIDDSSIYDLSSDEEIERKLKRERDALDEGSADVDDFELLREQAESYFKKPKRYPLAEDEEESWVTGYIGIYTHSLYDENGASRDVFTSTGDAIHMSIESVMDASMIQRELNAIGYQFNDLIQIKFYGQALSSLTGYASYKKGDSLEMVNLLDDYQNILYATPNEDFIADDSIYSSLNKMVQDEVLYGRTASEVLGSAFSHWSICREFFETRHLQISGDREAEASRLKVISLMEKRREFKSGFTREVELIEKLNGGMLSINDFCDKTSHELNRILWTCKSKDFSCYIKSKPIFLQLQALARKLKAQEETIVQPCNNVEAHSLVKFINNGGDISSLEISDNLLESTFDILWDRSSKVRIKPEYKSTYFELKKRFNELRKESSLKKCTAA